MFTQQEKKAAEVARNAYFHLKEKLDEVYNTCSINELDNLIHNVETISSLYENSNSFQSFLTQR
jgi:hypothetical protein